MPSYWYYSLTCNRRRNALASSSPAGIMAMTGGQEPWSMRSCLSRWAVPIGIVSPSSLYRLKDNECHTRLSRPTSSVGDEPVFFWMACVADWCLNVQEGDANVMMAWRCWQGPSWCQPNIPFLVEPTMRCCDSEASELTESEGIRHSACSRVAQLDVYQGLSWRRCMSRGAWAQSNEKKWSIGTRNPAVGQSLFFYFHSCDKWCEGLPVFTPSLH